ncbi:MAG TPA: TonB-dependent receptor [Thermoanaerobaculia bacterium]|nr:TonB-dependent receptor [Thermoanaerobaculia bacterium]
MRTRLSHGLALGLALLMLTGAVPALAQEASTLTGSVVTSAGDPVADAVVTLVDLKRRIKVEGDGTFRLQGLRPGRYVLEVESRTFGRGAQVLDLVAGENAVTVTIDVEMLRDEIVVSAGGPRLQLEVAQPTTVLSDEELDQRRDLTLGETLAHQPGISSTFFGQGASRPVIRGLGGDRVRMLSDGIGSSDASNLSPDHAVSLDPFSADRIEVLRGPSTLLYGSTAIGGVVNVLDERIPSFPAAAAVSGSLEGSAGSVADERTGGLRLGGGGGRLAWHLDVSQREAGDYEIPGFAEVDPDAGERAGRVVNSAVQAESGSLGLSWIGDAALVGVSVSGFDTLYGVPGSAHGEEAGVRIDLEQRRVDLKAELQRSFGPFRGAKLRLGRADYEHRELEGEETGTLFTNESWEGRFELIQEPRGRSRGSVGLQFATSDFAAIGEEAFVPPSQTESLALFAFEEVALAGEKVRLQLGGRWERQSLSPDGADALPDRSFDGCSGSLGLIWEPNDDWSASFSLARSERLPTATELYANGPHVATRAFEVGDPDLDSEVSLGLDASVSKRTGWLTATLNLFANRFDGFVFERATGEEEGGLAVFEFAQGDAELWGAELEGLLHVWEGTDSHLHVQVGADFVRAELRQSGEPLPRIPPRRYTVGANVHWHRFRAWVEAVRAEEQDRVAVNETATGGYTLVNAGASYRFFVAGRVLDLMLRGRNLTDEEARNHVSFLKDRVPLPGRDVNLGLRFTF